MKDIIKRNGLYVALIIFILSVNIASLVVYHVREDKTAGTQLSAGEDNSAGPVLGQKNPFDSEDMEEHTRRMSELAERDPLLYVFLALLNLVILFAVFTGLMIDVYLIIRFLGGKVPDIRIVRQEMPRWDIYDVIRVAIIFISCSYLFLFVQGLLSGISPVLRNENFRMIFGTAVMNVVVIWVIMHFVVRKYGQTPEAVGLASRKASSGVFYALTGYLAVIPVLLGVMIATFFVTKKIGYRPPVQPIVQIFMEEKSASVIWFSALFASVFGPVAEEIFFRGFMYNALKKRIGMFGGILATSVVFSFLHAHLVGFLPIMVLGITLAYLYEKTGSLAAPISLHIMHNVAMLVLVFMARQIGYSS